MRVSEIRVLLLLLSSVQCLCDCPLPPSVSTSCSDRKPLDNTPNIRGAPPSNGSCEFGSSFCNYSQGCTDPGVNDWTRTRRLGVSLGGYGTAGKYPVLQSPLLRIDHVTCFKFTATVDNPWRLSVYFGEEIESSCTVMSEVAPGLSVTLNKNINIRPATGKIFFRGTRGDYAIGVLKYIKCIMLSSVSLTTGRCEDPQCSFDNVYNDRACDHWEWKNWTVLSGTKFVTGNVTALQQGLRTGTLKTGLLMATGATTACLQFLYRMTGINDTLAVSVQHEDGITELMWQVTNHNESSSWANATIPLLSDNDFFIIFEGKRWHTKESNITIDEVKFWRDFSQCSHLPLESKPSKQQLTSNLDPSCDDIVRVANGSTEEYNPIPAIVGAVAGVVVLAVAGVVIAIVVWRMRKTNRSGLKTNKLSLSSGVGDGAMNNSDPSREAAAAPDMPSATETHYEGQGELSSQSHHASLQGTESASHAAASYYNIESTTQTGRNGPHTTSTAETQYEGLGEPSPPSVYTSLQNTAAASDTGTYYSSDCAQDNRSYYNVAPSNSVYYNVVKDPQNVIT